MNLHKIVRGAITSVNKDVQVTLYRSTGEQERQPRGDHLLVFEKVEGITAQIQSLTTNDIKAIDSLNEMVVSRRVYLYANGSVATSPNSQFRPLGRSGDYINDSDGNWWFANGVIEDFTNEGWICLLCTLQTVPPVMKIKDDDADTTIT